MNAVDMFGKEYVVPSFMGEIGNLLAVHPGRLDQRISVAKNLHVNTKWLDSLKFSHDVTEEFLNRPDWLLVRVEKLDSSHQRLHFQPIMPKVKDAPVPDPVAFSQLVQDIGLSDDKLKIIVERLLLMVFLPKTLKKLLAEERLEFIMDQSWMYLKAGNTAYRV